VRKTSDISKTGRESDKVCCLWK